MSVKELRELLAQYPDDMQVYHSNGDVCGFPVEELNLSEVTILCKRVKILELE